MDSGARGTVLNELGESIAREQLALQGKLKESQQLAVACTPLTEELLMQALNVADPQGEADVTISDDRHNMTEFKAGLMDLVLLDDPIYAYELEGASWEEVGSDRLLHVRKGEDYAAYRYGPQRLGFLSLEAERSPYRVVRTYSSLGALTRSGYSHFLSEGLMVRKGYRPRGDEPSIPYAILCLYRPVHGVESVLRALRPNTSI